MKRLMLALALAAPLGQADVAIQGAVQSHRTAVMDRVMRIATDSTKPVVVFGALLGIAILDTAEGVATARVALVTLVAVNLVVEGLKRATGRTRPDGEHKRSNSSFPSSHAANAAALAVVLSRRWPKGWPAFWALALLVSASRVYLNRHYVSDVVVAILLGAAIALLVAHKMRWRRPEPAPRPAPA